MYRVYKTVDGYNLHNIYLSDSCAHAQVNFTWQSIINFQPIAKIPGTLTPPSSSIMLKMSSEVSSSEELD